MGCEEGPGELCAFGMQRRRLRAVRGCPVSVFPYLMGGFEESRADSSQTCIKNGSGTTGKWQEEKF